MGVVAGGIGECGSVHFPSVYVRLTDTEIIQFIQDALQDVKDESESTKVMVINDRQTEALDLSSLGANKKCDDLPQSPIDDKWAKLGFVDNTLMICNTSIQSRECYELFLETLSTYSCMSTSALNL